MAAGRRGLGEVGDGVVACADGRIVYAGPADEAPRFDAAETIACDGRWITPGLIDCHTHLVYGGDRAGEFEMRLAGASYEAIARAGGGIVSTMAATRAASEADLLAGALPRLDALIAEGLADAVDAFCEAIGFSPARVRRVFEAARAHGLPVKLHAEQLSNLRGAALAAEFRALSA